MDMEDPCLVPLGNTGGLLSVSELPGDPDRMHKNDIVLLMEKQGFVLYRSYGSRRNITLLFRKEE